MVHAFNLQYILLITYTGLLFIPGLGDMAVSNTIGSNVFDILVGLGLPWALQTICISYGSEVTDSLPVELPFVFFLKIFI